MFIQVLLEKIVCQLILFSYFCKELFWPLRFQDQLDYGAHRENL